MPAPADDPGAAPRSAAALLARAWHTPGRELEQAVLRLVIGTIVYAYLAYTYRDSGPSAAGLSVHLLALPFLAVAVLHAATIVQRPERSVGRRLFAIALDISALSGCMLLTDAAGAPLYPLYLWVTIGNGFRFGRVYLYVASALSLIGFTLVVVVSPYWSGHAALSAGLLIGLIVLPLYVAALLRRLNHAVRRAEEASRAKSQFLANMTHELRTPLNAIMGMSELLRNTPLSREQRELTHTINDSVYALLSLMENVLDISRIEAGKLDIEHTDFDLHRLLNATVHMLRPQARIKDLALSLHIAPDVPFRLVGDPQRLRQVLVNLMANAIKFTHTGRVDVRVGLQQETETRAEVRFAVIDTGIGMDADALARIFESFAQADASTTRRYGGTGLGTTIAKELVELMGGRIRVQSRPGKGTRFEFTVPLERQPAETEGLRGAPALPVSGDEGLRAGELHGAVRSGPSGGPITEPWTPEARRRTRCPMRILVAEDNPINQKVITRILEQAGHEPEVVGDGGSALQHLERGNHDLAILDMQMPKMGGVEVIRRYRSQYPERPGPPMVVLTASATADAMRACTEAGADAYLTKPIEARALLEAIDGLARPAPARSGDEAAKAPPSLDVAKLEELRDLGFEWADLHDLAQEFAADNGALLAQMERALERGDHEAFAEIAHAIKGNAGTLGASALHQACARAERLSRPGLGARELLRDVRAEFERARSALLEYSQAPAQADTRA